MNDYLHIQIYIFILLVASTSAAAPYVSNSDDDAVIIPEDDQCQGHHHHPHHHHEDEDPRIQGYETWDEHMAKERIKAKFRARTSTDPATRKASEIEDEDELLDRMIEAHKARARKSKTTIGRRRNNFYQEEDDDSPGLFRRIRKRLFRW